MASKRDVTLKKGSGAYSFTLLEALGQPAPPDAWSHTFSSNERSKQVAGKTWEPKFTMTFKADNGGVELKENWVEVIDGVANPENRVVGKIFLSSSGFTVGAFQEVGDNRENFLIGLNVTGGATAFAIDLNDGLKKLKQYQVQILRTAHSSMTPGLDKVNFVRIVILNYRQNNHFDVQTVRAIMRGQLKQSMGQVVNEFIRSQKAAFNDEDQARAARLALLTRTGCTVQVTARSQGHPRLDLIICGPVHNEVWKLEINSKIKILDKVLFTEKAPAMDADRFECWTARITSISTTGFTAVVLNRVSVSTISSYMDRVAKNVTISIIDEDPLGDRLSSALRKMENCLACEMQLAKTGTTTMDSEFRLRVPMSRLFIEHEDNKPVDWPSNLVSLKTGAPTLAFQDSWRLEDSHKAAINKIIAGHGGIVGIQGPPGTGKSTLFAKCAAIAVSCFDLRGKIVLCAHSNQATQVLVEKCHEVFPQFGLVPEEHIVLVETAGAVQRRRQTSRTLPLGLEAYSLESQLHILANAHPDQFKEYLRYHGQFTRGEQLTEPEIKQYYRSRDKVLQKLQDEKTVFISTVSAAGSSFFNKPVSRNTKLFSCYMLFVDETSQCPMPAFIEAWEKMNPRHLIIGGDHNQLQSYAESKEALKVWAHSPIWHVARLGSSSCVLLNVQFRMQAHVYEPTSKVHYAGLIQTPAFLSNRQYERDLSVKLRKIEIDPQGNGKWARLGHNVLVLNLQDGADSRFGGTSTMNLIEARIVGDFIHALHAAGVSWSDIMALTPYEGQYQKILAAMKDMKAVGLAVRKIDSSQGAERPIVVFSPTVSRYLGFLKSTQRQNVCTSRQQSMFVMIGDVDCLLTDKTWNEWWHSLVTANRGLGAFTSDINHKCRFRVTNGQSTSAVSGLKNTSTLPVRSQPQAQPPGKASSAKIAALDDDIQQRLMPSISAPVNPIQQQSAATWNSFRQMSTSAGSPQPVTRTALSGPAPVVSESRNVAPINTTGAPASHSPVSRPAPVVSESRNVAPFNTTGAPTYPAPMSRPAPMVPESRNVAPINTTGPASSTSSPTEVKVHFPPSTMNPSLNTSAPDEISEEDFMDSLPLPPLEESENIVESPLLQSTEKSEAIMESPPLPPPKKVEQIRTPYDEEIVDIDMQKGSWPEDQASAGTALQAALLGDMELHANAMMDAMEFLSRDQIKLVRRRTELSELHDLWVQKRTKK